MIMIWKAVLILLFSVVLVSYFIRKLIYVSHQKHLFDEPTEDRKIHQTNIPNLGGVAIFGSIIFTLLFWIPELSIPNQHLIFGSALTLFSLGLVDDLVGVNPSKKMLSQFAVAVVMTMLANYRITSFYGLFGIYEVPYVVSIIFSVLLMLLLVNAFNLIDGINCLAAGIGLLASATFAYWFWNMHDHGFFLVAIALYGCLAGFFWYNKTPAKIFMGDTGSLLLGFMMAIFTVRFLALNGTGEGTPAALKYPAAPALVFALFIVPVYDTLRVFVIRILQGRSPFRADSSHIHHRLIEMKFTHMQATGILLLITGCCFVMANLLGKFGNEIPILAVTTFVLILNGVLWVLINQRNSIAAKAHRAYEVEKAETSLDIMLKRSIFLEPRETSKAVNEH